MVVTVHMHNSAHAWFFGEMGPWYSCVPWPQLKGPCQHTIALSSSASRLAGSNCMEIQGTPSALDCCSSLHDPWMVHGMLPDSLPAVYATILYYTILCLQILSSLCAMHREASGEIPGGQYFRQFLLQHPNGAEQLAAEAEAVSPGSSRY